MIGDTHLHFLAYIVAIRIPWDDICLRPSDFHAAARISPSLPWLKMARLAETRARHRATAGLPAEERQLVVVLDWLAPHLDERADVEIEKARLFVCESQAASPATSMCMTHTGMGR